MMTRRNWQKTLIVGLVLFAFGLRLWQLDSVPPGWRDDELINSLVISQKAINGDWRVYYDDASGHEALYHILNAFFLAVYGPSVAGIRWLSLFLGTLTIPLTYAVGRRFYHPTVGLVAAAALSVSFWSLMYSRIGIRHISLPVFALGAFYFFWQAARQPLAVANNRWLALRTVVFCALFTGIGFYTYFASRGVPLIMVAFGGYLGLFFWPRLRQNGRFLILALVLSLLLALPLIVTLGQQPEAEGRVAELAVPLVAARAGDFAPLFDHIRITLGMFHATGDGEWLYNIPNRPVFSGIGSVFFWAGVALALAWALAPLRWRSKTAVSPQHAQASAFLLLWWLAGISPDFISVPPASLGHAILAQPAVFLLAALPVWKMGDWATGNWRLGQSLSTNLQPLVPSLLALTLVIAIAARDWPAYFRDWPQRGMVRFLYRADIHDVATYLNERPELIDFGMSGLLSGPWDKLALAAHLERETAVSPRWYNPQRALLLQPRLSFSGYPAVDTPYADQQTTVSDVAGGYELTETMAMLPPVEEVCFVNGLCWLTAVYDPTSQRLELGWTVGQPLQLPPIPLISNPPPPGVYAGSRLRVFAQLHDANQTFLTGDDGLWVDPTTLQVGDIFLQQHWLSLPEGAVAETAVIGLYDPKTGERILTTDGRDLLRLPLTNITDE